MKNRAIVLIVVAFYSFLFIPTAPLWAQALKVPANTDLTAPIIQHEPPTRSFRSGDSVTIQATITDNAEVKEATLFYRTIGTEAYSSINMERLQQGTFSTSIPTQDIAEPGVEYYIQASDKAGNIALRGFSFSPLTVTVTPALPEKKGTEEAFTEKVFPAEEKQTALKTEATPDKPWYKKWWVWAIAGAVVVGAAAAGGGGGGGGGGSPTSAGGQTGSAAISGPTP
ncbi:MAG: hypothetical protein EPO39_15175 [Candidatus Manganitrophaceae bacterium]|nr:MAG: hypothetical protein EPO39_15175 [Candidatus Manganitrophaceae bacterium]